MEKSFEAPGSSQMASPENLENNILEGYSPEKTDAIFMSNGVVIGILDVASDSIRYLAKMPGESPKEGVDQFELNKQRGEFYDYLKSVGVERIVRAKDRADSFLSS